MRACLLIYDIPDGTDVNNPSDFLRSRAVRVNLSCWVMREDLVPLHSLNEMAEGGATWHVVRFADDEISKLIDMVRSSIAADLRKATESARSSMDRAAEKLADVDDETGIDKAELTCGRALARCSKRAERVIEDLRESAESFGIDPDELPIRSALGQLLTIQSVVHTRAKAYAKAARRARALDPGIARAAELDVIPGAILGDFLMDHSRTHEEYTEAEDLINSSR